MAENPPTSGPEDADAVQRRELAAILLRRSLRQLPLDDAAKRLVGLALSGGGIRSATFGLGVLEALKGAKLLGQVDYLSTVSGGGYIGAWLTANCRQSLKRLSNDPPQAVQDDAQAATDYAEASRDWLSDEADWTDSIRHLRRYSNYLSPQLGVFSADAWSMLAIWLRNTMLLQLTVVLAIAALLVLPHGLYKLFGAWPQLEQWRWSSVILFVLAVAGIAANLWQVSRALPVPFLERSSWKAGVVMAGACIVAAGLFCYLGAFDPFGVPPIARWPALLVAALVVLVGFFLLPVGARAVTPIGDWLRRIAPTLVGEQSPQRINYGQGWTQALVVFPILLTSVMFAAILWGLSSGGQPGQGLRAFDSFSELFIHACAYWPFPLSIVFVSLWLLSTFSWRRARSPVSAAWPALSNIGLAFLAALPPVVVLHALLCVIMLLMRRWVDAEDAASGQWLAFVWGPAMVLYAFSLTIVILLGMMGRATTEGVREWWARLGAWFLIYGAAWMLITVAAVYGPLWLAMLFDSGAWKGWSLIGSWLGATAAGLLAGKSDSTGRQKRAPHKASASTIAKNAVAVLAPYLFIAGLLVIIASVLRLALNYLADISDAICCQGAVGQACYWTQLSDAHISGVLLSLVFASLLGAVILLAWRVDINLFSLNAFYRGRLVRCYLGAARFVPHERTPQKFTQFDDDDELDMAEPDWQATLDQAAHRAAPQPRPAPGPLHIVNCALNLGGSSDLALHTRHADNFIITPYSMGSAYVARRHDKRAVLGYRPVAHYYDGPLQPQLGQAIATSGAAASPNMGYHTSTTVAFLLTLFNVRLGAWFPNPARKAIRSPSPRFSPRYLIKELFGGANEQSNYLMLSDGGHFENLAAYELLRRRCRLIILSDAECDPDLKFEGLGTLIRMCQVDFGYTISLNINRIVGDVNSPWSDARYAVGSINYGEDHPPGVLIYLKASMTGKEKDSALQQYKASHDAFPHESTGDQFYGEDQFESYRRLGLDIAGEMLAALKAADYPDLISAAQALQQRKTRRLRQRMRV